MTTTNIQAGTRMTLEEFLALPEMEQRCELHEGELYLMPQPTPRHQIKAGRLYSGLEQQLDDESALVLLPVDVVLGENVTVAPDIVVIRAERADIIHDVRIYGAPDIVVEVLSSNRTDDLVTKRRRYEAAGIPEYWILDGDSDTLTALALNDDGDYVERAVFTASDTLTTPLFPELSLPLARIFELPTRLRR